MSETKKPKCKLSGTDGNVFALAWRVGSALKQANLADKADEFYKRLPKCQTYDEALNLCVNMWIRAKNEPLLR